MIGPLLLGLVLSTVVAGLGYWRRALNASGVIGSILIGTIIFGMGGWIWGLLLIVFFVSSSIWSYYRRREKETFAEKYAKGSRRDLGQAMANGGLGALLALAYASSPDPLLFAAFLGAMGTVTADTWATEIGILSRVPPRLVTTAREVPQGTSGGVTRLGIWASVAGALLIGATATALTQAASLLSGDGWSLRAASFPLLALAGGLAGSLFDSLLGATVQGIYYCTHCDKETERQIHRCGHETQLVRGWAWLNNDLVNLAASIIGAVVAASLALLLWK